jgi:membrane-bound lytic murein transglycosylase A
LSREEIAFMTLEHPMVQGTLSLLLDKNLGQASTARAKLAQKLSPNPGLVFEFSFVLQCPSVPGLGLEAFLPPTLLTRFLDAKGNFLNSEVFEGASFMSTGQEEDSLRANLPRIKDRVTPLMEQAEQALADEIDEMKDEAEAKAAANFTEEEQRLLYLQKVNSSVSNAEIQSLRSGFQRTLQALDQTELRLDGIRMILLSAFFMLFVFTGCGPREIRDRSEALRFTNHIPEIIDDLGSADFIQALEANVNFLKSDESKRFPVLQFGESFLSRQEYASSLEALLKSVKDASQVDLSNPLAADQKIKEFLLANFEFHEVYGDPSWGDVFMTSYYEPFLPASPQPKGKLTQPLYGVPSDMVEIQLSKFTGLTDLGRKSLVGRMGSDKNSQGVSLVLPYFTRKEIDQDRSVEGNANIIAYVDPIDAFFLHIQGSGTLEFEDRSSLRVGYSAQNGHKYEAIGAFLKDQIPIEKMTAHTIESHLRNLDPKAAQAVLNKNQSYIFFKIIQEPALTFWGIPAIPGRTLATDTRYFPKGALGFLQFEKPIFENPAATEPQEWVKTSRFVFDHDKGGAINGPGRLDLFWGRGATAKQSSGVIKNRGKLWYLRPKNSFLKSLGV